MNIDNYSKLIVRQKDKAVTGRKSTFVCLAMVNVDNPVVWEKLKIYKIKEISVNGKRRNSVHRVYKVGRS